MNKDLPEQLVLPALASGRVAGREKLPSIFRFITEARSAQRIRIAKILSAALISGLLLLGIIIELLVLYRNEQAVNSLKTKRALMTEEISSLLTFTRSYNGYRDIYFRLAQLEYNLGNMYASGEYVKKTMDLDPNYVQGEVLAAHIKAKLR
jgi:hypothetical protein